MKKEGRDDLPFFVSIVEAAATQKLPDDGCGGYFVLLEDGFEVAEELEQTASFAEFGLIGLHLQQNGFGQGFEHSQLVQQSRVNHHIGFFLKGENVFVLATSHAGPSRNGILC